MRYRFRAWLLGCAVLLPLSACAQLPQACPFSAETDSAVSAGCFYVQDDKLLVVQDWMGKVSLPGGLGKRGESAQCTAYRETWEETGLLLEPGERVAGFKESFFLYRCGRNRHTGNHSLHAHAYSRPRVCQSACLHLSACLSACLPVYLTAGLPVCPPVRPVCLPVCSA